MGSKMTIFEKREERKRRGKFLTRAFWRREQTKERIRRKIKKCREQANRRVVRLEELYETVGRRYT